MPSRDRSLHQFAQESTNHQTAISRPTAVDAKFSPGLTSSSSLRRPTGAVPTTAFLKQKEAFAFAPAFENKTVSSSSKSIYLTSRLRKYGTNLDLKPIIMMIYDLEGNGEERGMEFSHRGGQDTARPRRCGKFQDIPGRSEGGSRSSPSFIPLHTPLPPCLISSALLKPRRAGREPRRPPDAHGFVTFPSMHASLGHRGVDLIAFVRSSSLTPFPPPPEVTS